MLYQFYEWSHSALTPFRMVADAARLFYQSPLNPLSHTATGRTIAAAAELFERSTRIYGKPEFGLHETVVRGVRVPVQDKVVWEKPFGRLLFFDREVPKNHRQDPRFLVVAPLSGHHSTLLRGTVEALLPDAEVYITDWTDAREVPVSAGKFDLEDYTDYIVEMLHFLGPDTHIIGVCQPTVPVLMAVARMEEDGDECSPTTMTLMGGPIDTRVNSTEVTELAETKGIDWFRENLVMPVPFPHPGVGRMVYPGFLQLSGFKSMNLDRHMIAEKDFFWDLVQNDGDSAEKHRTFYDEYNAVLDMTAEFYLQTVDEVFVKHSLPKGEMMYHGRPIDLTRIRRTALLTIEGENDDISGVGQTEAAQKLCINIPGAMRIHYVQPKVGHYGVFNGSRFRSEICPRIIDFALTHGTSHAQAKLPKRPETVTGDSTYRKFGAYAERDAKAKTLRRGRASAGETVLAGAVVPDSARTMRAMSETAEAMMKTAFGKSKPLGKHLSENPADDRDDEDPAKIPAPAAPAAATPVASLEANVPVSQKAGGAGQAHASETVANSNVKPKTDQAPKATAPAASSPAKAVASAAKASAPAAKSRAAKPAKPAQSTTSAKSAKPAKAGTTRKKAAGHATAKSVAKAASKDEVVALKPATEAKAIGSVPANKPAAVATAGATSPAPKSEPRKAEAPAASKPEAPSSTTASDAASSQKSDDTTLTTPATAKTQMEPAASRPPETATVAKPVAATHASPANAPAKPSPARQAKTAQAPSKSTSAKSVEPAVPGTSSKPSETAKPATAAKAPTPAVERAASDIVEQPRRGRPIRQSRRAKRAAAKPGKPQGRR